MLLFPALHTPQLAASGVVDRMFSLCFGFPSGGALLLGDAPLPPRVQLAYTPLLASKSSYYVVKLDAISIGGRELNIEPVRGRPELGRGVCWLPPRAACPGPDRCGASQRKDKTRMAGHARHTSAAPQAIFQKGYGTVMDSGTTFTYLPTSVFAAFTAAINAALAGKGPVLPPPMLSISS